MTYKRGFTLTELLIAMTLILLILTADASIRMMGQGYLSQVTNRAIAQNEAALAMASIVREINSAGYVDIRSFDATGTFGRELVLVQDTPPAAGAYPDPNVVSDALNAPVGPADRVVWYYPDTFTPPLHNIDGVRFNYYDAPPNGCLSPGDPHGKLGASGDAWGGGRIYDIKFEAYPDNTQTNSNAVRVTIFAQAKLDADRSDEITLISTATLNGRSAGAQGIQTP